MIEVLLVICFIAVTAYCLVVLWPRLSWTLQTLRHPDRLRPQYRTNRPRFDLRDLLRR